MHHRGKKAIISSISECTHPSNIYRVLGLKNYRKCLQRMNIHTSGALRLCRLWVWLPQAYETMYCVLCTLALCLLARRVATLSFLVESMWHYVACTWMFRVIYLVANYPTHQLRYVCSLPQVVYGLNRRIHCKQQTWEIHYIPDVSRFYTRLHCVRNCIDISTPTTTMVLAPPGSPAFPPHPSPLDPIRCTCPNWFPWDTTSALDFFVSIEEGFLFPLLPDYYRAMASWEGEYGLFVFLCTWCTYFSSLLSHAYDYHRTAWCFVTVPRNNSSGSKLN